VTVSLPKFAPALFTQPRTCWAEPSHPARAAASAANQPPLREATARQAGLLPCRFLALVGDGGGLGDGRFQRA